VAGFEVVKFGAKIVLGEKAVELVVDVEFENMDVFIDVLEAG